MSDCVDVQPKHSRAKLTLCVESLIILMLDFVAIVCCCNNALSVSHRIFTFHYPVQSATQRSLHRPPPTPERPACWGWCLWWWRSSSRWLWLQDQGSLTTHLTCRCDKLPHQPLPRRSQRPEHTHKIGGQNIKKSGWQSCRRIFVFFHGNSSWWQQGFNVW